MQIQIPDRPRLTELPRNAWAPWLRPGRRRFRLVKDFIVYVDDVRYVIPTGYVTDKASVPRWLHWLFSPDYDPAVCASIWHDKAYSHWYLTMTKQYADEVFHHIMLYRGAKPWIARAFRTAVSLFGRGGWA